MTMVAAGFVIGGCSIRPPGQLHTGGGRVVTNGTDLLAQAHSDAYNAVTAELLMPESTCYLSTTEDRVLCGPVRSPGTASPDDWVSLAVGFDTAATVTSAHLGSPVAGASVAAGERLVNDSGREVVFVAGTPPGAPNYAIVHGGPNDRATSVRVFLLFVLAGVLCIVGLVVFVLLVTRQRRHPSRAQQRAVTEAAAYGWAALTAPAAMPPLPSALVLPAPASATAPIDLLLPTSTADGPIECVPGRVSYPAGFPAETEDGADESASDVPDAIHPPTATEPTDDLVSPSPDHAELLMGDGAAIDAGIEVCVMGRVEVSGAPAPDRAAAIELAALLALHPDRRYTGEQLRDELFRAADDSANGYATDTLRVYMSSLRRAWGAPHVPSAAGGAGYRLVTVTTDWQRFRRLVAASDTDPESERPRLVDALTLVRGAPFAGIESGTYGWAWGELLVAEMETAIGDAAHRLARAALAGGDRRQALWAAGQGLRAVPGDPVLHDDALLAADGDPAALDRAWDAALAMLGVADREYYLGETYRRLRGPAARTGT